MVLVERFWLRTLISFILNFYHFYDGLATLSKSKPMSLIRYYAFRGQIDDSTGILDASLSDWTPLSTLVTFCVYFRHQPQFIG